MEIDQDMMDEDMAEDTMMELHHDSSESDDTFESDDAALNQTTTGCRLPLDPHMSVWFDIHVRSS